MNIPNILTMLRFVMTLGFLYLFPINILASAGLFVLAAVTDFFDGYLARKYNRITAFGKIADPIADKFLILSAFAIFAFSRTIPWWMFWIIAVREIGVTLFRFWAMSKGKVLAAEKAGKVKTVLQITAVGAMLLYELVSKNIPVDKNNMCPVSGPELILSVVVLSVLGLTVIITVVSGVLVIWNNRNILKKD